MRFVRNALFGGLSEPDDVERHTGLPVLAAIPYSDMQDKLWRRSRRKNASVPALLAQSQGNAPPIESLRSFRNVLQASLRQSANNMVMFTGPVAGVGKSFLSANFAFIQGGVGKRVLLIDADFRKGQLNRYFGVPKEDGLFEVLSGTIRSAGSASTACPRAWTSSPRARSLSIPPSCWPRPCSARPCASWRPSTTW